MSLFEDVVSTTHPNDAAYRNGLYIAGDTCYAAKAWFEQHNVPYTAADLVAFAAIVTRYVEKNPNG